jgi:spore coat protein U-like protein
VFLSAAIAFILACGHSAMLAQGSATANLNVSATVKANCTVTTVPVNFGNYDATTGAAVDQSGAVKLTCTKGTPATISLGLGGAPLAGQRTMAGGTPPANLRYELYSDAGRVTVWNDTTGKVSMTAPDNTEQTYAVYGRILSGQTTVSQGGYSDTVLATVNF